MTNRYYKPARDPGAIRGFFSYITEAVHNIGNAYEGDFQQQLKVYFDLENIPGYVSGNMFDVCFLQDKLDYETYQSYYKNIEELSNYKDISFYDNITWNIDYRKYTEQVIQKHFCLNPTLQSILNDRLISLDLNKTVGVHRRATDIGMHSYDIKSLDVIFNEIESTDFDNVFLLCDNIGDFVKFKNRYGNKLISYDEFTTSSSESQPFHKSNIQDETLKIKHIEEIVLGAFILGRMHKLVCSHSNLTNFSILSNSKLNYILIN